MQIPFLPHWILQSRHQIGNTPESPRIAPERAETFGRNQTQTQHENTTDGTTDGNRHGKINRTKSEPSALPIPRKFYFEK